MRFSAGIRSAAKVVRERLQELRACAGAGIAGSAMRRWWRQALAGGALPPARASS
jgi:hypothetical protein